MPNLFTDIETKAGDGVFHAVVEIPKDSKIKYEYADKMGCVMVDRFFKTPIAYPQNYGFFPQTWNKYDNDPMDVIVISNEKIYPGVVVPVRVIGIIEMDDTGEVDHKILAVPEGDPNFANVKTVADLNTHFTEILPNLEWFLANYKGREKGKEVIVHGTKERDVALAFLDECMAEYEENHK